MVCKRYGFNTNWGTCWKLDPVVIGRHCSGKHDTECEEGFECADEGHTTSSNRTMYGNRCVPKLAPKDVFCTPKCQFPSRCICGTFKHSDCDTPHIGVCTVLSPHGKYCTGEGHCAPYYKCAALGDGQKYGVCKLDDDPSGRYCLSTKDCQWSQLEECNDQGECVK